MLLNPFTYHSPKTIEEASNLFGQLSRARFLAGGTFLINNLKSLKRRNLATPDHIVSLKKISGLHEIKLSSNKLDIGSMTTLDQIIQNKDIEQKYPILKQVAENIATTQIRNMATIGGNVCCRYTWAEFASCLIALEATLCFHEKGEEIKVLAEDFYKNSAKSKGILTKISINLQENANIVYQRASKTSGVDVPMLTVCIKAQIENKKIKNIFFIINDGSSFSKRDLNVESALKDAAIQELEEKAINSIDFSSYALDTDYKKDLLKAHIKYAIQKLKK